MTGDLPTALRNLLALALPGLFGGATPAVGLSVSRDVSEVDPSSADAVAGEPRADDRADRFPFNPTSPTGPYTLTQPPYPGPRIVRLLTAAGDRLGLRPEEIVWDAAEPRRFTLAPRPGRDLTGFSEVHVLYAVAAVFTTLKATDTLLVDLQSADAATLERAEALALAVIALNRQHLIDAARTTYEESDYGAAAEIKELIVLRSVTPAADTRRLTLRSTAELKVTRALREDEGRPIVRIRTPGRSLDPDRPIDIQIDVES